MSRVMLAAPPDARSPASVLDAPPITSHPNRGATRWRLEASLAIAAMSGVLLADALLLRVGLDPQDEGYFVEQATRVLHGQLPYRDFDSLYTPGLLYLHAAVIAFFGGSPVVDVRVVGLFARIVLAVGLYGVCRQFVRPAIAVLPVLFVLVGLDRLPNAWEPHPGWPSAAFTVLGVWASTRLPTQHGLRRGLLLLGLGALAGFTFAFKQNTGVLLMLALGLGVVFMSDQVTRPLRCAQFLFLVAVIAAAAWLIHPYVTPPIAAYFLGPLCLAGVAALRPIRVASTGQGLGGVLGACVLLALGWTLVSLPWLLALAGALDGDVRLLQNFVGITNQDILWYPLAGPSGGAWASLFGLALALLALARSGSLLARLAAFGFVVTFGVLLVTSTAGPGEALAHSLVMAPGRASEGVAMALPVVSVIAGAWLSLAGGLEPRRARMLRWLTLASAVTFLTEYPRVDEVHLTWSACLPLATGAVVLADGYRLLQHRWHVHGMRRAILAVALVLVPLAAVFRNVGIRGDGLVLLPDGAGNGVRLAPLTLLTSPPPVAGLLVPSGVADHVVAAAAYVAANTAPGEPIFVYPTAPLVYLLADRPNPTRFAHLYPGAASRAELTDVIAELDHVNVVVVSVSELAFWGPPDENALLEQTLVQHYAVAAHFGDTYVLRRR